MRGPARILLQAAVHRWLPAYRWIPIVGGFAAFALACAAGANDLPISFATSVGAGTLTMLQAVVLAGAMEFSGAVGVGNTTVDVRYLNLWRETPPDAGLLMWGFFIVLIAATIWLSVATYFELPVSSVASIQGALLGIVLTTRGVEGVNWFEKDSNSLLNVGGVAAIFVSWTVTPLIAATIGFLYFGFTKYALLRSQDAEKRTLRALPFYYAVTVVAIIVLIIVKGAPRSNLYNLEPYKVGIIIGLSGVIAAILAYTIVVRLAKKRVGCFRDSPKTQESEIKPGGGDGLKEEDKKSKVEDKSLKDVEELTAEELLRQFVELRVLDTVYEGDEELGDQTPPFSIKGSPHPKPGTPARPLQTTSFGQLLAGTPNRIFPYKRLRRDPPKLTKRQQIMKSLRHLRAQTIEHKMEYDRATLVRHALAEKFDDRAEELFSFLQILTAMATAFVQGSNDIAGCMVPYAGLRELYVNAKSYAGISGQQEADARVGAAEWALAVVGSGAAAGLAVWGWRVVRSVGGKVMFMSPARGFTAQLSLIVATVVAAKLNLPMSTTHSLVGALVGVGIADSTKNVNWRLLLTFAASWIITLLASCTLATALYSATIFSPSFTVVA